MFNLKGKDSAKNKGAKGNKSGGSGGGNVKIREVQLQLNICASTPAKKKSCLTTTTSGAASTAPATGSDKPPNVTDSIESPSAAVTDRADTTKRLPVPVAKQSSQMTPKIEDNTDPPRYQETFFTKKPT